MRLLELVFFQYFIHDPYFWPQAQQIQFREHIPEITEQNKQKSGVLGGMPTNYSQKPILLRP